MTTYPNDSPQCQFADWWVAQQESTARVGSLIYAFSAFVGNEALALEAVRPPGNARQHSVAHYRTKVIDITAPFSPAKLPVAALVDSPGALHVVLKGKVRPMLVVCDNQLKVGGDVVGGGSPNWQRRPTLVCAPYYGAEPDGRRAGYSSTFIDRIRRVSYPQLMWDLLPTNNKESVLRFDHLVAVPNALYSCANFRLSQEAKELVLDWLKWYLFGLVSEDSDLVALREMLGVS